MPIRRNWKATNEVGKTRDGLINNTNDFYDQTYKLFLGPSYSTFVTFIKYIEANKKKKKKKKEMNEFARVRWR